MTSLEFRSRDHALAVAEAFHALAQLEDRAGDFVADHAGRLGGVLVEAHAGHHVSEVDARRRHRDAHLARSQLRIGPLLHLQDARAPVLGDDDRSHGG